ncbi:MAG: TIM barrel protein [Candidatus Hydrogenedentes bacterium]|nr:TIM barrel protein [Candidatus Hydrogenedentota bacterium]
MNQRTFGISLAAWSLHRTIGEEAGRVPMLDMPKMTRQDFGIDGLELVSTMLASTDAPYLARLAKNASDNNVRLLLIMIDDEGDVAAEDVDAQHDAVARHKKWIDIAADFGCHSIRLNWRGTDPDAAKKPRVCRAMIERSVLPLRTLCDYGDKKEVNVLLENHGGPSSYPEAVVPLVLAVDHPRFGTLPDFGNYPPDVDIYLATDLLMNFAKSVSAKCMDFDDVTGLESTMDFERLIEIVVDKHGYRDYIGIEYGGERLTEADGILACKRLLERLRDSA